MKIDDTLEKRGPFRNNFFIIAVYIISFLIVSLIGNFQQKRNLQESTFIVLCAIPLLRNGYFLARAYTQKDRTTFYIAIVAGMLFIAIALNAR